MSIGYRRLDEQEASTYLGHVRNNGKLELAGMIFEELLQVVAFALCAYGGANRISLLEGRLDDPKSNVAIGSRYQDLVVR
jgi:hypothetical protein